MAAGVMTAERPVPDPLSTMLASGTRVRFEDVAVTISAVAAVSVSPITKPMAEVATSSLVDAARMLVIVGALFGATVADTVTVTVPVAVAILAGSTSIN